MNNFKETIAKSLILSLIYNLLFNTPLMYYHACINEFPIHWSEINLIIIGCAIIFSILLHLGLLGRILTSLMFMIGGSIDYFLLTFKKNLDCGVITDIFSIETALIFEYITTYLVITIIASGILGWWIYKKIKLLQFTEITSFHLTVPANLYNKKSTLINFVKIKKILYPSLFLCFVLQLTVAVAIGFDNPNHTMMKLYHYQPFSIFYDFQIVYKGYITQLQQIKNKRDLTKEYRFLYKSTNSKPVIVIMVIGESMRGDLVSINGYSIKNMPLLEKRQNLVSFTNATSSAPSTRLAIPYMITRAEPPNYDQAISEKGLISIYKHLGFKTAWIGSQGLFGIYETSFASHAMEADLVIHRENMRIVPTNYVDYDEELIEHVKARLDQYPNDNHFIVVHLFGSHWQFTERYPKEFGDKFTPVCNQSTPIKCSSEELLNAYHNTILYTDFVLDKLMNLIENKNSLVVYSSDHGFSFDGKAFGNGYSGAKVPDEQRTIAMFVWMSQQFKTDHQAFMDKIKEKQNIPVSHDYLFHSILNCSDVESQVVNSSLSFCQ